MTSTAGRRPLLVGANPLVSLFDGDRVTAFASVWRVEWSERGHGDAIVLWHDGRVRVLGDDPGLGYWLSQEFTRHFPEATGLPWPEPSVEWTTVKLSLDLRCGLAADAGDVTVSISEVMDRRTFATDSFNLGGVPHGLSLVLAPARAATLQISGHRVPGEVRLSGTAGRPVSSAFLTGAEVWTR
jgi:hypothetical protein